MSAEPRYWPAGMVPIEPGWYWSRYRGYTMPACNIFSPFRSDSHEYYGPIPEPDWEALREGKC